MPSPGRQQPDPLFVGQRRQADAAQQAIQEAALLGLRGPLSGQWRLAYVGALAGSSRKGRRP